MPTLEWIAKKAVVNHHREVPFRLLQCAPARSVGDGEKLARALASADMEQETEKVKKTHTTSARNALRKRIEGAVDRIRGVGMLHYLRYA